MFHVSFSNLPINMSLDFQSAHKSPSNADPEDEINLLFSCKCKCMRVQGVTRHATCTGIIQPMYMQVCVLVVIHGSVGILNLLGNCFSG